MTKVKRSVAALSALLFVLILFLFFSFDLVVYVTPSQMKDISGRWSHPFLINPGFICISRSDSSPSLLERIRHPDILIYAPYSLCGDGSRNTFYTVVRDGEEVPLDFSYEDMYSSFLSSFPGRIVGIVYEEESPYREICSSLQEREPSLLQLKYANRVSAVNEDDLISASESAWAVIVTDPLSSSSFYRRTEARIVMDERDAVAAVSLGSVISLHYDWKRMIESDFTASYYTFSVLHD